LVKISGSFYNQGWDNSYQKEVNTIHEVINSDTLSASEIEIYNTRIENLEIKMDVEKLKIVEHIFIYLLPLFIIFGFYNYYKYTTSVMLTGDEDSVNLAKAMENLNASKMILISSILSFVLIKVIEVLFLKSSEIKSELIIPYGVLILLLMFFVIFLHKLKD
jgi:hypothetical protein